MRVQEKAGFLYGVIYGLLKEGFGVFLDQQKGMRLGSLDPGFPKPQMAASFLVAGA